MITQAAGGCTAGVTCTVQEDAPPVLESPALLSLLDEQKRVESLISQRRTDIRDSFKSMDRHKRKIRVTVTNTHANQQPPQVCTGPR
ncbi:hypothetical protein DUNSADRAFT_16476 [Dunaliella salina]|uniref:Encoded protein n=1 Tax=Dunaliella salina TaxID=3046 RepID=A0ABQ7H108_DUNSA|nr:hypothetical protein DUNSADRAFT_16476 [Dunaliella salina]|eukprot:KAF5840535.1 hypothetical protein DUNSADRAFT_16476 [Dunaliella salina]